MSSTLRAIFAVIKKFDGITVEKVVEGNHYKLFLDTPAGKQILVISRSTSCGRAMKNNETLLRRWSQSIRERK